MKFFRRILFLLFVPIFVLLYFLCCLHYILSGRKKNFNITL